MTERPELDAWLADSEWVNEPDTIPMREPMRWAPELEEEVLGSDKPEESDWESDWVRLPSVPWTSSVPPGTIYIHILSQVSEEDNWTPVTAAEAEEEGP